MKTGTQLTKAQPASSGAAFLQRPRDVDGPAPRCRDHVLQILADAVVRHAALHLDAQHGHVGEADGVVRLVEDGLGEVAADLAGVHVEGGAELDVARVVAREVGVHEPGDEVGGRRRSIELDALDQRRRAVPHADDGDPDLAHGAALLARWRRVGAVVVRMV
jgi:hypothetical protein